MEGILFRSSSIDILFAMINAPTNYENKISANSNYRICQLLKRKAFHNYDPNSLITVEIRAQRLCLKLIGNFKK